MVKLRLLSLLFFCCFSISAKNVKLFLSFNCFHCMEAMQLALDISKKHKVEVFLYPVSKDDARKILFLLVLRNDLKLFKEVLACFVHERDGLKKVQSKYPLVHKKVIAKRKQLEEDARKMKSDFTKYHIEGTPTWLIGDCKIEGIPEDFEKIFVD